MEERQFSKAREELSKRDGQAQEAILQMLRKFDDKKGAALPAFPVINEPLKEIPGEQTLEEAKIVPRPRRRENMSLAGGELRRNRRMGKFVEELPTAVEEEPVTTVVDVGEEHTLSELGPKVVSYEPAPWEDGMVVQRSRLGNAESGRMGPKVVSYGQAPWEDESTDQGSSHRSSEDVAMESRAGLGLGPRVISYKHAPWEESMEESSETVVEEEVEGNGSDWRLGPRVIAYDSAPWEDSKSMERKPSPSPLEDIIEDDEDVGSPASQYTIPGSIKNRVLTPPTDYTHSTSPGGYFPVYKFPPDAFPPPSTPRSVYSPSPPVSEFTIPKTPPKSPTNLRTRAGLKKIFLSTIRSKKRDENEQPLSPSPTPSSTASTPSIPTPSIRITSPFHPRRMDGSSIYGDDVSVRTTSPISSPIERLEPGYRLPELRLSRADWSEWGRQVADRL
jgi:hypothetical protein